ncbi:Hsp70 family protein [Comamonas endophytica]|uniref:Hsp70 family protein n=1 Tax=Comamonas endophytica TaxID=2949090 RepID=UPI001E5BFE39|nr:Hsp70 family protein [Acidovorax sp. D4N7]MCD2512867.1 hsp70 family protein [Acidovorax sp. D4N7]
MAQYIVGIDLGTSHTLLAYAPADGSAPVALLPIPQRISAAEIAAQPLLPSLRYQAGEGELAPDTLHQPWPPLFSSEAAPALLGRYAQELGAQVPGRLVSSAKSWLSHAGVDRSAPILPWGAPEGVQKISPLQASASYLAHLRAAWDAQFPDAPLAQQALVLTVPASFDEGARALTLQAAQLAGLPPLRLLEEPQAALHDWLMLQSAQVGQALQGSEWLLVVDIGGGTTDLSLVQVTQTGGLPELARRGVGAHLMLGGDNMDLALAHGLEAELAAPQPRLSATRFAQLVQRCRAAKEQLLAPDAPEAVNVTLLGSGAQLMGGARSAQLRRDAVREQLLEGFFPLQPRDARPRQRQGGLLSWGLPYPADAAITRHLAAFLQAHADLLGAEGVPDSVLFNGGVFHGTAIAERVVEQLAHWRGAPVRVLVNPHPDWAVARGAVAHGLARMQPAAGAVRIGGGSARSYFLRLDEGEGLRAICLLPQGSEEGVAVRLEGQRFALRLGQAVRFHLLASTALGNVPAGAVRDLAGEDVVHLPPLSAVLPAPPGRERAQVEVQLQATMTEVGTLQVQCVSTQDPDQRWPLEFALRAEVAPEGSAPSRADATARAIAQIERIFGSHDQSVAAKEVRQLRAALEKMLGPREGWDLALLRTLFDALLARARRRRRTPEHERSWLNLAGYCLRPGVGAELDEWRIAQVWALHGQGLAYTQDSGNWSEWWIFWRRAAAGLCEAQQMQLLEDVAGHMQQAGQRAQGKGSALGSYDDMVRLFAVMENVPWAYRLEMGQWMLDRLRKPGEPPQTWWALGRLCSRVPLGPAGAHQIIPPEQLDPFLEAVLAQDWRHNDSAMFAAVQMARMTGDRARDLSDAQRAPVLARLQQVRAPANWQAMVAEVVELDAVEQRRSFGESLPPGLVLIA